MENNHARVLFITSAAFNHTTGGGITFSNLFRGWPKDCLATVHNDPVTVETDVCEQFYRLSDREIRRWGIFRYTGSPHNRKLSTDNTVAGSTSPGLKRKIKEKIFGDGLPMTTTLSTDLEQWIGEFRPDLIYTILGSNPVMELVEQVADKFNLPVVIHLMDDWPNTIYRGGLLSIIQRKKMESLLARLIHRAELCMGICDAMCEAYEERYKKPFTAFHNTVDTVHRQPPAGRDLEVQGEAKVVYVGSIFRNAQIDSLVDCCKAVSELADSGLNISMDIYSPPFLAAPFRDLLVIHEKINLYNTITCDDEFYRLLRSADVLLLPVNFDEATIRYIRYSMPTKVPAYQLSGTPILVYGPSGIAQVDYAGKEGWGYVLEERNVELLKNSIIQLITDINLRKKISSRSVQIARQQHDCSNVRKRFQMALLKAANKTVLNIESHNAIA